MKPNASPMGSMQGTASKPQANAGPWSQGGQQGQQKYAPTGGQQPSRDQGASKPWTPSWGSSATWQPKDNQDLFRTAAAFGVHDQGLNGTWSRAPGAIDNMNPAQVAEYTNRVRDAMRREEAKWAPQQGGDAAPAGSPQQGGWGDAMPAPGKAPWSDIPSRDFDYQTAFNAAGQAVNSGNIMGRLNAESRYSPNAGSASGNRAASDLQKSMLMENAAQGQRGIEQANAQQNAQEQAARSEAMQSAMSNQARMYSDATNRANDQLSLAAQIQQAMMESRNRFRTALMT